MKKWLNLVKFPPKESLNYNLRSYLERIQHHQHWHSPGSTPFVLQEVLNILAERRVLDIAPYEPLPDSYPLPEADDLQIKEVSMDMTGNYKSLVKKLCPNADATVDRFHVTKMLHEELNQARIAQKKAAEALNIKERTKIFDGLKGSKYILLKAEDNLSDKQKEKLKQVKEASPLVGIMHSLKEEFHFLFEHSQNLGEGTLELIDWLCMAQPYYKKSVATIKRWLAEIVGYFDQRTTNGIVEGINNKLKLLKRCGFGFRNFINFEVRALLSWHFPNNLAQ